MITNLEAFIEDCKVYTGTCTEQLKQGLSKEFPAVAYLVTEHTDYNMLIVLALDALYPTRGKLTTALNACFLSEYTLMEVKRLWPVYFAHPELIHDKETVDAIWNSIGSEDC